MKKIILSVVIILSFGITHSQQNFKVVKEINLSNFETKNLNKISAEFKSGKKLVSKSKAINLVDILKMCDKCFLEIEDSKNNYYYLSQNDLNKNINSQQILLLFDDNFSSLGDTLVLNDDDLSKIEDNELLKMELGSISNLRYTLNSKDWNDEKAKKYFKSNSIIYPFDNSTLRWITDVKKIRILSR